MNKAGGKQTLTKIIKVEQTILRALTIITTVADVIIWSIITLAALGVIAF